MTNEVGWPIFKTMKNKSISEIATVIRRDWKNVNFAAVPYLSAMRSMNSVNDNFGLDDGKGIVARFLVNASTWRGEVAREVKKELNRRLK